MPTAARADGFSTKGTKLTKRTKKKNTRKSPDGEARGSLAQTDAPGQRYNDKETEPERRMAMEPRGGAESVVTREAEMTSMTTVALRRWTRDEYDRMVDAGILGPEDRVELVDGEIVIMTPQKSRHAAAIQMAIRALRRVFDDSFDVRSQMPLALGAVSEPEPDIAVVAGSPADFIDAHPSTAVLIIEVADTSLTFDRTTKAAVYARAGLTDYWIVNLVDRVVEVRRDPQASTTALAGWHFASVHTFRAGDILAPLARPDARIAVGDILP